MNETMAFNIHIILHHSKTSRILKSFKLCMSGHHITVLEYHITDSKEHLRRNLEDKKSLFIHDSFPPQSLLNTKVVCY